MEMESLYGTIAYAAGLKHPHRVRKGSYYMRQKPQDFGEEEERPPTKKEATTEV